MISLRWQGLRALEVISLGGSAPVSLDPLGDLVNLRELSLGGHQITDVTPLLGLRSLTDLRLRSGRMSDLAWLRKLPQLTYLALDGHQITDITPLAELTGLENLYLSYNRIRDVRPLAGLHSLRHLRLINNEVVEVTPLAALTNLETLWLEENRITDVSSPRHADTVGTVGAGWESSLGAAVSAATPAGPAQSFCVLVLRGVSSIFQGDDLLLVSIVVLTAVVLSYGCTSPPVDWGAFAMGSYVDANRAEGARDKFGWFIGDQRAGESMVTSTEEVGSIGV